jgi:hypothetical protein
MRGLWVGDEWISEITESDLQISFSLPFFQPDWTRGSNDGEGCEFVRFYRERRRCGFGNLVVRLASRRLPTVLWDL